MSTANGTTSSSSASNGLSSDTANNLTIAAFVLSIGAIFLSIVQALLAYLQFDNSEVGRRRCSEEVMGKLWAEKTTRKFKWPEFRYQVFFEVPVFYTAPPGITVGPLTVTKPEVTLRDRLLRRASDLEDKSKTFEDAAIPMEVITIKPHVAPIYKITGTEASFKHTMTRFVPKAEKWANVHTAEDEGCSWVLLLDALQGQERASRAWDTPQIIDEADRGLNHGISYLMQRKRRCWDFMPLNATKPFATTTMCHLVEIMSMLGLVWTEFDMKSSILTAVGNGYMMKSEYLQGLGILTRFSRLGTPIHEDNRIVPCVEVKQLCFGEVPSIFGKKEKVQVSPDKLESCLEHLLPHLDIRDRKRFVEKTERPLVFSSTFELIAMVAKSCHIPGSRFRRLPNPCGEAWTPGLDFGACLNAFATCIKSCPDLGGDVLTIQLKNLFEHGRMDSLTLSESTLEQKIKTYILASSSLARERRETWDAQERLAIIEQAVRDHDAALLDLLDALHSAVQCVDARLQDLTEDVREVLTMHFTVVFNQWQDLKDELNKGGQKEEILMNFYFDQIRPAVTLGPAKAANGQPRPASTISNATSATATSTVSTTTPEAKKRSAIWLALTFRMWAWLFLHDFNPLDKMIERSEFIDSRLPVYIG